jgi:hypothetical protein
MLFCFLIKAYIFCCVCQIKVYFILELNYFGRMNRVIFVLNESII